MNTPIRTAVIGLGRAGWLIHLKMLENDPRFQVIAVADPDSTRTTEAAGTFGCATHSSLEELLKAGNLPELIVIATPSAFHVADATAVLKAGCHCILEKPMATNYKEAAALTAFAAHLGKQLFIHQQRPLSAESNHLKAILQSRILGNIFHISTSRTSYARRWDWQTLRKNGGGLLNNHGSHTLSILLPLLDSKVIQVHSDLRQIKDAGDTEDHVHLLLKCESGQTASVLVTTCCALPTHTWQILGTCGTLTSDGRTTKLRYYDPAQAPSIEVIDSNSAPNRQYPKENLPWQESVIEVNPGDAIEFYTNVYEVLRKGEAMLVTPQSVLEIMRVIDMARASADKQSTPFKTVDAII